MLQAITLSELFETYLTSGSVYWQKNGGSVVKILEVGDFVDACYLQKFQTYSLSIEKIAESSNVSKGTILIKSFLNSADLKQKSLARKRIISWISDTYWSGNQDCTLLDLALIGQKVFYKFDEDVSRELFEQSLNFFRRSSVVSTLTVLLAICAGYLENDFLEDLYHISFLHDAGLLKENLGINHIFALEEERIDAGAGFAILLLGDNPGPEMHHFKEHVENGLEFKEKYKKFLNNELSFNLIAVHHERPNGKGFPKALHDGEMSDLDSIISFVNLIIPYQIEFKLNDGGMLLQNSIVSGDDSILARHLKKTISGVFVVQNG